MVVTGADEKFFGIPHLSHARRKKFNGPGRLLFKPETFSFSPSYIVHKVCPIENNTNLNSIFCLIKSSKIDFIFLTAFYLIM
jgi:hypothetical protein